MTPDELFDVLDVDSDGELAREELFRAACSLGWHWREAPFYAVLDHFTVLEPLSRQKFVELVEQIVEDPYGPFGRVLRSSPVVAALTRAPVHRASGEGPACEQPVSMGPPGDEVDRGLVELLRRSAGPETADDYQALLAEVGSGSEELRGDDVAILIIDPQISFTSGAWKRSADPGSDREVEPLRLAFANCASFLGAYAGRIEAMFTRCPFPPKSYGWDQPIAEVVDDRQLYFVKPGNSVLWPPTNGVTKWLEHLVQSGTTTLVVGGCTLNSCVRVSAIDMQSLIGGRGLQVVVDLSLCGARANNYIRSAMFGGRSSVESAIREMMAAGVQVRSHHGLAPARVEQSRPCP